MPPFHIYLTSSVSKIYENVSTLYILTIKSQIMVPILAHGVNFSAMLQSSLNNEKANCAFSQAVGFEF